ncbi:hypothetical protein [Nonomuraea soli]
MAWAAVEEPTPQEWLILEVCVAVVAVSTVAMVWLYRRVLSSKRREYAVTRSSPGSGQ